MLTEACGQHRPNSIDHIAGAFLINANWLNNMWTGVPNEVAGKISIVKTGMYRQSDCNL